MAPQVISFARRLFSSAGYFYFPQVTFILGQLPPNIQGVSAKSFSREKFFYFRARLIKEKNFESFSLIPSGAGKVFSGRVPLFLRSRAEKLIDTAREARRKKSTFRPQNAVKRPENSLLSLKMGSQRRLGRLMVILRKSWGELIPLRPEKIFLYIRTRLIKKIFPKRLFFAI